MTWIRPATPGFIVTLIATILLTIVSFCVPFTKSVFFLRATITANNANGSIVFGTLGYCIELPNGTTCSNPSIGYRLNINGLVGNTLPVQIPPVVVKWITSALVLHIVALVVAAGSAVFGLLAHIREMSMAWCSTCISEFAAVITLFAFIFDLILFFIAKARINAVGSAHIGSAIWLTLTAWILLFLSGCFYSLGRSCISNRSNNKGDNDNSGGETRDDTEMGLNNKKDFERRRLDAVKAEADRKAFQNKVESGLPAFPEAYPLTGTIYGDQVYIDEHSAEHQAPPVRPPGRQNGYPAGGYVRGAPGTRAMDDYHGTTYPPQRQASSYAPQSLTPQHTLPPAAAYGSSPYGYHTTPSAVLYGNAGPSYFATSGHEQQTSSYSQYSAPDGNITSQSHLLESSYNPDTYNTNSLVNPPMPSPLNYANRSATPRR